MTRPMMIGLAAAAAIILAAPAMARDGAGSHGGGGHGTHDGNGHGGFEGDFGDFRSPADGRHDRRRRGFGGGYYGRGAYVDGSAWRPDSFNDWWHESPHRAFPRWMANNQSCERLWWSGGGWRC